MCDVGCLVVDARWWAWGEETLSLSLSLSPANMVLCHVIAMPYHQMLV